MIKVCVGVCVGVKERDFPPFKVGRQNVAVIKNRRGIRNDFLKEWKLTVY